MRPSASPFLFIQSLLSTPMPSTWVSRQIYQQSDLIIRTDFHIRTRPCCKRSILRCARGSKLTEIKSVILDFKETFAGRPWAYRVGGA